MSTVKSRKLYTEPDASPPIPPTPPAFLREFPISDDGYDKDDDEPGVGELVTPFDEPISPPPASPTPSRVDGRTNEGKLIKEQRRREGLHPDGHPHTPAAPYRNYAYDQKDPARNDSAWFDFMRELCENHRYCLPRLAIYVYRKWPVVNLPTGKQYIDKVAGEDWDVFDYEGLLRRYGSGQYQIRVNDQMTKDAKGQNTVCLAMLNIRDMEDFPPIIKDMLTVDWNDPSTVSYIQYLQRHRIQVKGSGVAALENIPNGIDLNHESESRNEDAEMAAVTEKLLDRVFAQEDRAREREQPPPPPVPAVVIPPPSTDVAPLTTALVEMVKNQSNAGIKLSDVMSLVSTIHPPQPNNLEPIINLLTTQMAAAEARNNQLMQMILAPKAAEANLAVGAVATAPATPRKALEDALEISNVIKDAVQAYMGETGAGGAVPAGDWKSLLMTSVMQNLPAVLGLLNRVVSMPPSPTPQVIPGQAVQVPATLTPLPPGYAYTPDGRVVQTAAPQPQPLSQAPLPAAGQVLTMPSPNQQPQTQSQPQNPTPGGQDPMFMRMIITQAMDTLGPEIMNALMTGMHGADFADKVRAPENEGGAGESGYQTIVGLGEGTIMEVLTEHPTTAAAVRANRAAVMEFVEQFCHPERFPDEGPGPETGTATPNAEKPGEAGITPPVPASKPITTLP